MTSNTDDRVEMEWRWQAFLFKLSSLAPPAAYGRRRYSRPAGLSQRTLHVGVAHGEPDGPAADPARDLLGSRGRAVPCDAICGLARRSGGKEAPLHVARSDLGGLVLSLAFDGPTCTWAVTGSASPEAGTALRRLPVPGRGPA